MSLKLTVNLAEFRRAMKDMGYRVRTRTNSQFIAATIIDSDGNSINNANVLSDEHLKRHQPFYAYKAIHSVRDSDMVVTF